MNDTKREELGKACKKEKDHKVRARMVAVRMVRVRNMTVDEVADIQGRSPNWVRNRLRRYDDGGLEGLRDLPCARTPWKNAGTGESASCYSGDQKFLQNNSAFLLKNLIKSRLNLAVR